jgi:hypothetical protein
MLLILGPVAYWILVAHSEVQDDGAKTLDQVALGTFAVGSLVLLMHA